MPPPANFAPDSEMGQELSFQLSLGSPHAQRAAHFGDERSFIFWGVDLKKFVMGFKQKLDADVKTA